MSVEIYKCFVASPNDTTAEREACDRVFNELNAGIGKHLNFRIESWRWENNSRPSFGTDGQSVINEQVGDDYQLFIGIMYKKFGTPTPRAGSGTEEEFNIAYNRYVKNEQVEIMIYFNNEPVSIRDIDPIQLAKVNEFRDKIAALGGLYGEYKGTSDFEEKLRNHLQAFFLQKKLNCNLIQAAKATVAY